MLFYYIFSINISARTWGSGSRVVTSDMFGRFEESYQKYKRPDGYNFMKESKSVGVPVALDSSTYRHAFSESRDDTGGPSKRAKTLSGQPAEAFEYRLARSVRRLGELLISRRISQNSSFFH